jgi:hypothetical protein
VQHGSRIHQCCCAVPGKIKLAKKGQEGPENSKTPAFRLQSTLLSEQRIYFLDEMATGPGRDYPH